MRMLCVVEKHAWVATWMTLVIVLAFLVTTVFT